MKENRLIQGDNLDILKTIESDTIDLIYLDPPFFSNRNYEVIWGDSGEVRSFQDRWAGGIGHYIDWLKERVEQMHRILKPTGSIFLHCDWHADAYIRVLILDKIFGYQNFRNEIVWFYKTRPQSKKYFGRKHDTIYFYSKSSEYTFNWKDVTRSLSDTTIGKYRLKDEKGRLYRLQGRGIVNSPIRSAKDVEAKWEITNPELVVRDYLDEKVGVALEDWWDIEPINQNSKELIGYPTQKPEILLERIIKCVSNEDDVVLDPFVGGGTTVAVADKLNRKWIGIDQSAQAIKVTELRLIKQRTLFTIPFTIQLHKYDYEMLRYSNAFEFESWIVQQFGGTSNTKQRGDLGLDGKMSDNTPIQVKRSDNIGRNVIDNFLSAIKRADKKLFEKNIEKKKPTGFIIAFSFSRGAVEEVARLKLEDNIVIELVTVDKIVEIAKKPSIKVDFSSTPTTLQNGDEYPKDGVRTIEFTAIGQSESGIGFYSWDFDFNVARGFRANVIIDKTGKQTAKFKEGQHNIAVKVVDNDGLEKIEVIKLKVGEKIIRETF